jgi:hypothetical protein
LLLVENNQEPSKESTRKRGGRKQSKEMEEEEEPKGYIHVRARRGQATDSHSLSERVLMFFTASLIVWFSESPFSLI